jgi:hypothetical protein
VEVKRVERSSWTESEEILSPFKLELKLLTLELSAILLRIQVSQKLQTISNGQKLLLHCTLPPNADPKLLCSRQDFVGFYYSCKLNFHKQAV